MKITITIQDELVALAQQYAPELTVADAENAAKGAINSMVIQKVTEKIKADGEVATNQALEDEMANVINLIQ